MICFAFAVPHEAQGVLAELTEKDAFRVLNLECITGKIGQRSVLVAIIGMGLTNARENTQTLFQYFRPKCLILSGYGGALVPQVKKGQVILSKNYTSPQFLTFVRLLSGFDFANFCSVDRVVATPAEREQIHKISEAQVVDMETSAVVESTRESNTPFLAIRVISDDVQDHLPSGAMAAAFDSTTNRPKPLSLLWYLLLHPGELKPFQAFVKGLGPTRATLTAFLLQVEKELPPRW